MKFNYVLLVLLTASLLVACERTSRFSELHAKELVTLAQNLSSDIELGFEFLIHAQYGSQSLNDEIFENLWQVWDGDDGLKAQAATQEERRAIAFARYGFSKAPYENSGLPMGYAKGDGGEWLSNCLLCHSGTINGQPIIGAPNNRLDLASLNEDILLLTKACARDPSDSCEDRPTHMNTSVGLTNAVVFSHELLKYRDVHLDISDPIDLGPIINHDLDAPPWWHIKHKSHFYSDAFVQKNPRALMQFAMGIENDGEHFRAMLHDFERVLKYLETIIPPQFPGTINSQLALNGKAIFETKCASCHGTYGTNAHYPNRKIPQEIVKTDNARLHGLTREFREYYALSWLSDYGAIEVSLEGTGYVAPPLHGIWASAPYFHNGSVPTLYAVLSPQERPTIWKVRVFDILDLNQVGLLVDTVTSMPTVLTRAEQRRYYDTTQFGKSNHGHTFSASLSKEDKFALIEYMKTL